MYQKEGCFVKSTGVVRRIDELGRIVIPKEIRRNLRIRDSESMEIFVDKDTIALKKYSPMNDLEDYASVLVDSIYETAHVPIMIADRDQMIAAPSHYKKKYLGKIIGDRLEKMISRRGEFDIQSEVIDLISGIEEEGSLFATTVLVNADSLGLIFVFHRGNEQITDLDRSMVRVVKHLLEKHIDR